MSKRALMAAIVAALSIGAVRPAAQEQQRNPGISTVCGEYKIGLIPLITPFGDVILLGPDFPDEGWAYVDPAHKRVQATGVAHDVKIASTDTPANHYSHDIDFSVLLDPGQIHLLSTQSDESLPIEWESGIRPNERSGDGQHPIFPKWAWPSEGDRMWVEGNWIFDCGHPEPFSHFFDNSDARFHTEIHPPRALAAMRDIAAPIPGTGTTPVPVTLTDLYISGNGGFAPNQLNCGLDIILGSHGGTCGQDPPPANDAYKTTPINDTDFEFDVCLPGRPRENAVVKFRVDAGPANTVAIAPDVQVIEATGACVVDNLRGYDHRKMLHVKVPLNNTATVPTAVYSRRIYAGWVFAPDELLPHRRVTLTSTDLHEDHDLDPGDGELTFWWLNLNRAENAWFRLSDFATGDMDDYDDDFGPGQGMMHFRPDASFDFYLRHDETFKIRSMGYEQDCFDTLGDGFFYTHRQIELAMYLVCYADLPNDGAGDPLTMNESPSLADNALGSINFGSGDYDVTVDIAEVAPTFEDTSYLTIGTGCAGAGEVPLIGQPITCATRLTNDGPALPRRVNVKTQVSGPSLPTLDSGTWTVPGPFGSGTFFCSSGAVVSDCQPLSVPVAAATPVNITTIAVPAAAGLFTQRVEVTTSSTDPDLTDNVATATLEVFQAVAIDVSPKDPANVVNLTRGGSVTVAILTTDTFNAATVDPRSVCFGDAEAPAERTCIEQHVTGHLEDVNKDRRPDLVLHFEVSATGIDVSDTAACLRARTTGGIGLYGCEAITTKK
jgi:hypothetical protein